MSNHNYEFFYRSQIILSDEQPTQVSYAILDGQVVIQSCKSLIKTLKPGQFLTARTLTEFAGSVAIAHTNCRLIVVNPLLISVLAHRPLEDVLRVLRLLLERSVQKKVQKEGKPQLRWPASTLARRKIHSTDGLEK